MNHRWCRNRAKEVNRARWSGVDDGATSMMARNSPWSSRSGRFRQRLFRPGLPGAIAALTGVTRVGMTVWTRLMWFDWCLSLIPPCPSTGAATPDRPQIPDQWGR